MTKRHIIHFGPTVCAEWPLEPLLARSVAGVPKERAETARNGVVGAVGALPASEREAEEA